MKRVSEAELAAYLAERDQRASLDPFQGTITAVDASRVTYAVTVVQVQRVGESRPDPHWHACALPGYTPQVGDRVDLAPRDQHVSQVVAPLAPATGGSLSEATLYAHGPPLVGTLPANPRFLRIEDSHFGTTNGSAILAITFPLAFPNGLLNVKPSVGDTTSNLAMVQVFNGGSSRSGCQVVCLNPAGAGINSLNVRVNYDAVGF